MQQSNGYEGWHGHWGRWYIAKPSTRFRLLVRADLWEWALPFSFGYSRWDHDRDMGRSVRFRFLCVDVFAQWGHP